AADAGTDAFQVLVDALVEQQAAGLVRSDEPRLLAVFIWSVVHGVAMLALDGMLKGNLEPESLMRYANERLRGALAPGAGAL
ncbi:MAG: TetR-like C-terminal domain-containing protein, partial [Vicinamibacterales bacterium]